MNAPPSLPPPPSISVEEGEEVKQQPPTVEPNADEVSGPTLIHMLEEKNGINKRDINKLLQCGYHTVESVAYSTHKTLASIIGMSDHKAMILIQEASKLVPMGFTTAFENHKARQKLIQITTGSSELDKLLDGGIESGAITEFFGESNTGKTQLCHTLCVTCQLPKDKRGAEGKALYIDTDGSFRPERLIAIAERYDMDEQTVLDNVVYARAYNSDHQAKLLVRAAIMLAESRFALIVVDCATALFRANYHQIEARAEGQVQLAQFLRQLRRLADEFGVAVVITNQAEIKVEAYDVDMYIEKETSVDGDSTRTEAHISTTRLHLKKGRGESRICLVHKSPSLPLSECSFQLGRGGIVNCD